MKSRILSLIICFVMTASLLAGCGGTQNPGDFESQVESQKPSESESQSPSESQTPTLEPSESESQTPSPEPSESESQTPSPEPSESESQTPSPEPSESESQTPTPEPSESQKPTPTPKPSESESQKPKPTPTPTPTPDPTEPSEPDTGDKPLTTAEKMAKDIVDDIIKPSMSDFEKAITIHDWLTFNIDYDFTYSNYIVEETLRDRTGVCEGYTLCFEMMAKMAGLEVNYVSGMSTNSVGFTALHAWNQVKISGVWYNVDVTWDDPSSEGKDPNDHKANCYDYFLISKAEMEKDHTPDYYRNGEKSCPKNYDRVEILKYGVNNGRYENAAFVETREETDAAIQKFVKENKSEFWLWLYDTSMKSPMTSIDVRDKIDPLIADATYPASIVRYYQPKKGVGKFLIKITPLSEWNKIPVVSNGVEFSEKVEEIAATGVTTFDLRYETTDGNFVLKYDTDKYKLKIYQTGYGTYNDGKSKLLTIEILEVKE